MPTLRQSHPVCDFKYGPIYIPDLFLQPRPLPCPPGSHIYLSGCVTLGPPRSRQDWTYKRFTGGKRLWSKAGRQLEKVGGASNSNAGYDTCGGRGVGRRLGQNVHPGQQGVLEPMWPIRDVPTSYWGEPASVPHCSQSLSESCLWEMWPQCEAAEITHQFYFSQQET